MALYLQYWPLHLCKRQNAFITHTVESNGHTQLNDNILAIASCTHMKY